VLFVATNLSSFVHMCKTKKFLSTVPNLGVTEIEGSHMSSSPVFTRDHCDRALSEVSEPLANNFIRRNFINISIASHCGLGR